MVQWVYRCSVSDGSLILKMPRSVDGRLSQVWLRRKIESIQGWSARKSHTRPSKVSIISNKKEMKNLLIALRWKVCLSFRSLTLYRISLIISLPRMGRFLGPEKARNNGIFPCRAAAVKTNIFRCGCSPGVHKVEQLYFNMQLQLIIHNHEKRMGSIQCKKWWLFSRNDQTKDLHCWPFLVRLEQAATPFCKKVLQLISCQRWGYTPMQLWNWFFVVYLINKHDA